jgi:hypothetical protein
VVNRQFGSEKRDCLENIYIAPKSYSDEECVYAFLNRYKKEFPKVKGQTKEELVWRRSADFYLLKFDVTHRGFLPYTGEFEGSDFYHRIAFRYDALRRWGGPGRPRKALPPEQGGPHDICQGFECDRMLRDRSHHHLALIPQYEFVKTLKPIVFPTASVA